MQHLWKPKEKLLPPMVVLMHRQVLQFISNWQNEHNYDQIGILRTPSLIFFNTHISINTQSTHTCKEHGEQKCLSSELHLEWRQTHLWASTVRVHWGGIISFPVPHLTSDLSVWAREAVLNVRCHRVSIGTWSSMPVCTLATKVKYVRGSGWHAVKATVHHRWRRVTEDTHTCTRWD